MTTPENDPDTTAPPAGDGDSPVLYLILLAVLVIPAGYGHLAVVVMGPQLQGHFDISSLQQGMLLTAAVAGALPALLVVGPMSDRWGAQKTIRVGLLGMGMAFMLCGLTTSVILFAIGLGLMGFFFTDLAVSIPAYLVRLYPDHQRRALAVVFTVFNLPQIFLPSILDRLMTAFPDNFSLVFHLPYLGIGIVLVVGQLLFAGAPADPKHGPAVKLREGLKQLMHPTLLIVVLLCALHAGGDNTFHYWFPTYYKTQFSPPLPLRPGDVVALVAVAYSIVRSLMVLLPEGRGQRALLVLPGLIGGSLLATLIWLNRPLLLAIGYPISAFIWCAHYPAALSEASSRAKKYFASFLAVNTLAMQVATAVVVLSTGALLNVFSMADTARALGFRGFLRWIPDRRAGVMLSPLCLILFGLVALITGIGKHTNRDNPDKPDDEDSDDIPDNPEQEESPS